MTIFEFICGYNRLEVKLALSVRKIEINHAYLFDFAQFFLSFLCVKETLPVGKCKRFQWECVVFLSNALPKAVGFVSSYFPTATLYPTPYLTGVKTSIPYKCFIQTLVQ